MPAISVKVIKNTFNSHYPAIVDKAEKDGIEVVDLILNEDPEVDYVYMGKISSRTKTIYLDDENHISYNLRFKESIVDPGGEQKDLREYERKPANINGGIPLTWTNKYIPIAKAVRMFVFSKIYQLRHTNGLTWDFLFEMATHLEQKKAFMMIGAGPGGKEPLRFSRGGSAYRAFLSGRTRGDSYRLSLHLTNLELKDFKK